jgi:hypothetical protein
MAFVALIYQHVLLCAGQTRCCACLCLARALEKHCATSTRTRRAHVASVQSTQPDISTLRLVRRAIACTKSQLAQTANAACACLLAQYLVQSALLASVAMQRPQSHVKHSESSNVLRPTHASAAAGTVGTATGAAAAIPSPEPFLPAA